MFCRRGKTIRQGVYVCPDCAENYPSGYTSMEFTRWPVRCNDCGREVKGLVYRMVVPTRRRW